MANILDALHAGIAAASVIVQPVKTSVTVKRWASENGYGTVTYATPDVTMIGVVEMSKKPRYTTEGKLLMTHAAITVFPQDYPAATGATGRSEPIDVRDKILLPDGTWGPVVDVKGVLDPGTLLPLALEILLGEPISSDGT